MEGEMTTVFPGTPMYQPGISTGRRSSLPERGVKDLPGQIATIVQDLDGQEA
ncbi:hypothetical protein PM082_019700 [Marasmius tenuissimus]|nr:hypothetical protein PM082_019700 [Marasmius tenuissimus]